MTTLRRRALHVVQRLAGAETAEALIRFDRRRREEYWWPNARYRRNRRRFEAYRNLHRGKRCFILGNGPSLARMDLAPLRNEFTIGTNRIYLLFPEMGFTTTYLASVNPHVLRQWKDDFLALSVPKFLSWGMRSEFPDREDVAFLYSDNSRETFTEDISAGGWEGGTVTYVALQLAFFMGFDDVILIGVDHSFQASGPAHQLVTSAGSDQDHFHPDYFGKGVQWQLPDLEMSERGYRLANSAYLAAGRRIRNATTGGRLKVFPLVDYTTVLNESRASAGAF
jgi:hypothetical protein